MNKIKLSEVERGNLPEKEFRVVIVRMIQHLGKRMESQTKKIREMFNTLLTGGFLQKLMPVAVIHLQSKMC